MILNLLYFKNGHILLELWFLFVIFPKTESGVLARNQSNENQFLLKYYKGLIIL